MPEVRFPQRSVLSRACSLCSLSSRPSQGVTIKYAIEDGPTTTLPCLGANRGLLHKPRGVRTERVLLPLCAGWEDTPVPRAEIDKHGSINLWLDSSSEPSAKRLLSEAEFRFYLTLGDEAEVSKPMTVRPSALAPPCAEPASDTSGGPLLRRSAITTRTTPSGRLWPKRSLTRRSLLRCACFRDFFVVVSLSKILSSPFSVGFPNIRLRRIQREDIHSYRRVETGGFPARVRAHGGAAVFVVV